MLMSFRLKSRDFMKYLCLNCSIYLYKLYIYEQHGFHPEQSTITCGLCKLHNGCIPPSRSRICHIH